MNPMSTFISFKRNLYDTQILPPSDSYHNQIFRKNGHKKVEPNSPYFSQTPQIEELHVVP
jgi:hypothetical protein